MLRRMILIIVMFFSSNANAFASMEVMEIVDFIVSNNPQVIEARKKYNIDYKVQFTASGYTGIVEQHTNKAAVGLTISVPLVDTKERNELNKAKIEKEANIRTKAADVVNSIIATTRAIKSLTAEIAFKENYLRWLQKRVEAGIDYQKDVFKYQETLISDKVRLSELESKKMAAINEALSLVNPEKRNQLNKILKEKLWKE